MSEAHKTTLFEEHWFIFSWTKETVKRTNTKTLHEQMKACDDARKADLSFIKLEQSHIKNKYDDEIPNLRARVEELCKQQDQGVTGIILAQKTLVEEQLKQVDKALGVRIQL